MSEYDKSGGRVMGERKHTPGPWVAESSVDEWGVSVIASNETGRISNPTRGQVCHVSVVAGASGDDADLAQANARLIAAAPEMKEALEGARGAILGLLHGRGCEAEGSDEDWVKFIDAALAKANGESPQ